MDPRSLVISLSNEGWIARCLHVVAQLRVADKVSEEAQPISDIAQEVGADPRILGTILRILGQRGIFVVEGGNVSHSDASNLLRSDNPATLGDIVRWNAADETWLSLGKLLSTVTSGKSGFEVAFGHSFFDYLAANEDVQSLFNGSMEGFTRRQVSSILAVLDFSPFQSILDIGGGTGILAAAIAQKHPDKIVSLFEMPGVAADEALSVGVDRICVALYDKIVALRPDWHSSDDDKGAVKIVMTGAASDPIEWQQHIGAKKRRDLLAKQTTKLD